MTEAATRPVRHPHPPAQTRPPGGGPGGQSRSLTRARDQGGSALPLALVLLSLLLVLGWMLVGVASQHYLRGTRQSRELQAAELAQAGVAEAVARIQAGTLPADGQLAGQEETGRYEVAVEPTPTGLYTVRSTGIAVDQSRSASALVAPPLPGLLMLAGGSIRASAQDLLGGGDLVLEGQLRAGEEVSLEAYSTALYTGLSVRGDVQAGANAYLWAGSDLLASASTQVEGDLTAGGDVGLVCERGELGTYNQVAVSGTVAYNGSLEEQQTGIGLLAGCGISTGAERSPANLEALTYLDLDPGYYEAMAEDLAAKGLMQEVEPGAACGTLENHSRVTGDLACPYLKIGPGVMVVVDGTLTAGTAEIEGLLYVRGGPAPDPRGGVDLTSLSLLQVVGSAHPHAGGGSLVATGSIMVREASLIALLPAGAPQGSVLQVLALRTGEGDDQNDIDLVLSDLVRGVSLAASPPLFLYTGAGGQIRISDQDLADLLAFDTLPLAAVAGGDIILESGRLAGVATTFTLEARDEIWRQVPPPLRGIARAQILRWEWEAD